MKTFLRTLFFFLLVTQVSIAQWYQQSSGTNSLLHGVSFNDANHGCIVGMNGTVLKTTDGGNQWVAHPMDSSISLFAVDFINADTGWAVGHDSNGVVLKTTDGGQSWVSQLSIPHYEICDVSFCDLSNGSMVGYNYDGAYYYGVILRTTDGGQNWSSQSNRINTQLFGVCIIDANNGTSVGNNTHDGTKVILRTTDGGHNWISQNSGMTGGLLGVSFTDSIHGTVVGYSGTILRTTDGGQNWISQISGTPYHLSAVSFTDSNTGVAVGGSARFASFHSIILRTTDGGQHWEKQLEGNFHQLWAVSFSDEYNGTAVGAGNSGGTILRTTNGGITFVEEEEINEVLTEFLLSNNYPNPFNPTTTIKYQIPELSFVTLKVYDVLGEEIETIVKEEKTAGTYEVNWYPENLPSGVYFYQMKAGSFVETKRMLLLR